VRKTETLAWVKLVGLVGLVEGLGRKAQGERRKGPQTGARTPIPDPCDSHNATMQICRTDCPAALQPPPAFYHLATDLYASASSWGFCDGCPLPASPRA